ncbi:hypothetical protein ACFGVR_11780 [Mucilaginibacter sp. AW1-3]
MKLNQEQLKLVQQLVNNDVKFSETYIEVYDHVLTAFENHQAVTDIEATYNRIIRQDFGGPKGLLHVEESYNHAFSAQVNRAKWVAFSSFFKWPLLPGTVAVALIVFYIAYILQYQEYALPLISGLIFGPVGAMLANVFKLKEKGPAAKRSIKQRTFYILSISMFAIYSLILIAGSYVIFVVYHYRLINDLSLSFPVIITASFVCCNVYTIAVTKVYHTQFKILTSK